MHSSNLGAELKADSKATSYHDSFSQSTSGALTNFSEYVVKCGLKTNINNTPYHARIWFNQLCQQIAKMHPHFPEGILQAFLKAKLSSGNFPVEAELEKILKSTTDSQVLIVRLNEFYSHALGYLDEVSSEYFLQNLIPVPPSFYPFEKNLSGVSIVCRFRDEEGRVFLTPIGKKSGAIGSGRVNKSIIIKNVRTGFDKSKWLKTIFTEKLGKKLNASVDFSAPHAEDHFFLCYGEELLKQIQQSSTRLSNKTSGNDFLLSFLTGPRIEFISSTSPCIECQNYFKALRYKLNENNIYVPIVIYSNSQYNSINDRDCAVSVVDYNGNYKTLPFQWDGPKVRDNASRAVQEFIPRDFSVAPLNEKYSAILILNIFGEALLPKIARLRPVYVQSFLQSMLDTGKTSHVMVDWVKFYFRRVVRMSIHDFSGTSLEKYDRHESYQEVDLRFLRQHHNIKGLTGLTKKITQIAAYKNNSVVFFMYMVQMWHSLIYDNLALEHEPPIDSLRFRKQLVQLASFVKHIMFWDINTAPKDVIHRSELPGLEGMPPMVISERVSEAWRHINTIYSILNYISAGKYYRENILNAILSRSDSALGEENICYDDAGMSMLVHNVRATIKEMACQNGIWNLATMEQLLPTLEYDHKFEPELQRAITRKGEPKRFRLMERTFSRQQVALETGFTRTMTVSKNCPDNGRAPQRNGLFYQGTVKYTLFSKNESFDKPREQERKEDHVGPCSIDGWELQDFSGDDNCFFLAVTHQMILIEHEYIYQNFQKTGITESLTARVLGRNWRECRWKNEERIQAFLQCFDVILAVVDTHNPSKGFVYYCRDNLELEKATNPPPIIRVATTGNHYLSVEDCPASIKKSTKLKVYLVPSFEGKIGLGKSTPTPKSTRENRFKAIEGTRVYMPVIVKSLVSNFHSFYAAHPSIDNRLVDRTETDPYGSGAMVVYKGPK